MIIFNSFSLFNNNQALGSQLLTCSLNLILSPSPPNHNWKRSPKIPTAAACGHHMLSMWSPRGDHASCTHSVCARHCGDGSGTRSAIAPPCDCFATIFDIKLEFFSVWNRWPFDECSCPCRFEWWRHHQSPMWFSSNSWSSSTIGWDHRVHLWVTVEGAVHQCWYPHWRLPATLWSDGLWTSAGELPSTGK